MVASSVERNSIFATTISSTTARMPASTVAMRQPAGLSGPSQPIPSPISHFPRGGCTTNAGSVVKMFTAPALNCASASAGHDPSYPRLKSVQASFT